MTLKVSAHKMSVTDLKSNAFKYTYIFIYIVAAVCYRVYMHCGMTVFAICQLLVRVACLCLRL